MSQHGPRDRYADYTPSAKMLASIKAWEDSVAEEERLRNAARAAVAEELVEAKVSHGALARHLPWTEPTVQNIAREYNVPPLRKRKAADGES